MTEQQIIFKLLDMVEGIYQAEFKSPLPALSTEDLEDYAVCAIQAHKKYGRKCPLLHDMVCDLEGLGAVTLYNAGITFNDYQNACGL